MPEIKKREIANKLRVGDLLKGNQIFDQSPDLENKRTRLLHVELGEKKIIRINLVANVIEKFESQGETKFITITLDDGSGQIRARVFGEDVIKFQEVTQGDTVLIIGLLRSYNEELYVLPEIVRKLPPKYLLVRKLEIEKEIPKPLSLGEKKEIRALRDEIIDMVKKSEENDGIDKDEIIMKFKDTDPKTISQEIQKLIEDGIVYEPKPGRVRYLG